MWKTTFAEAFSSSHWWKWCALLCSSSRASWWCRAASINNRGKKMAMRLSRYAAFDGNAVIEVCRTERVKLYFDIGISAYGNPIRISIQICHTIEIHGNQLLVRFVLNWILYLILYARFSIMRCNIVYLYKNLFRVSSLV